MNFEAEDDSTAQEGFGEASLGEAQAENPPPDPEMIDGDGEGDEGADPDAEAPMGVEDRELPAEQEQAEG